MSSNDPQPQKRNIDERIDALTMNLELQAGLQRDSDVRLTSAIERLTSDIQALVKASTQDGENIRALARIAEAHEHR